MDEPVDRRTLPKKEPPTCEKCGNKHWYFKACAEAPVWVPPTPLRVEYRQDTDFARRSYHPGSGTRLADSQAALGYGVSTPISTRPDKKKGG